MPGVPGMAAFTPTEQGPGLAKVAPERQLSQHDASILQNALEVLFSSLHSRHAMLQAFRRIDTDGDKHIGAAEFLKACRILGLALSAKAGKLVVQLLDRSGDGTVPCSVSIARPRF
jgi:Ca2+-binding EF-hand superfamily protein